MKLENVKTWNGTNWARATARGWNGLKWLGQAEGAPVEIPSPTAAYPPARDELQALLRPEFAPVATLYVGEGKPYRTLAEAVAAVDSKRSGAPAPHNRVDIIVSPGTYVGNIKPPTHIGIIGETGNPEDVVIQGVNAQREYVGVLYTRGSLYLEGVTIHQPPSIEGLSRQEQFNPKYPIHHDHHGTLVLSYCKLKADSALSGGGGTCLGVDGGEAGLIFAHKTAFESVAGVNVNSHGPNTAEAPITNIYVDCDLNSGTGYQSLDSSSGALYLMGTTRTTGVRTAGPSVSLTIDPAASAGQVQAAGPLIYDTAYPEVRGAMSAYERKRFYGG